MRTTPAVVLLASLPLLAPAALGKTRADCERDYRPQRAQEGKDVIWVPTEDAMVVRMLAMANVTAADLVYDLGAGDGKIPIAAAQRFGARAVGIEYDEALAKHAQCLVEAEGVDDRVEIVQGDIFEADFSAATVITLYLLPELNLRLRPTLLDMPPGTRVVSYSFTMRDWEPDEFVDTDEGSAYFWIVPAKVSGAWTLRASDGSDVLDVTLEQRFQKLRGSVGDAALTGSLRGARIAFSFVRDGERVEFSGSVTGEELEGTLARGAIVRDYVGRR